MSGVTVTDCDSAEKAARELMHQGAGSVIVTLGSKGSLICDGTGSRMIPSRKVNAVDTTAAGDTYCGALCVALSEGRDIVAAAGFATAASAIAVTRPGAQESIPTRDEVDKAMESADDRCTSPSFAQ